MNPETGEARGPVVPGPLCRGSTAGAECHRCPFARFGEPNRPVLAEFPEAPAWILLGELPGFNDVHRGRPFMSQGGEIVNTALAKVGRPREQIYAGFVTLCAAPQGASEAERERAASACRPRLLRELAQFPGLPVLTLGAIAARTVIPKATLDAIDPPDTPKAIKKAQKLKQQPTIKHALARKAQINKMRDVRLQRMLDHERKRLIVEAKRRYRKRPDAAYLATELARVHGRLLVKAQGDAIREYEVRIKERAFKAAVAAAHPERKKKAKHKAIKLTDIVSTLFDLDVDGSGVRPIIPTIHPAALLKGGGASIGGSHTPDMAFVNLLYDVGKVDNLARGKDIRLKLNIEYELEDPDRAGRLFLEVFHAAIAEGACSLDLETYVEDPERHSALMAYVARIRVIGLAVQGQAISLAWDALPPWCHSLLQVLLGAVEMTYHNGLYDRTVLGAHGFIMGPRWFDTLLAHHAAFPGNAHRLQTVGAQFYGVPAWKSEFRNAEEDPVSLAVYNAQDTGVTHALRAPLTLWMQRTNTLPVYELDKIMSATASQMHLDGMPIDRAVNQELLVGFTHNVKEARREVEDIARDKHLRQQIWHHLAIQQARKQRKLDPSDFEARYQIRLDAMAHDPDWKWKLGSSKHIAALLLAMGVGLFQTTASGDISTKKDVLESLTDVPVIRSILNFRENDKLLSTFIYRIFDRHEPGGGIASYGYADAVDRIHPIWNVHRISGRWASQWPVVSNVPKDKWRKVTHDALVILRAKLIDRRITPPTKGTFELDGKTYRYNTKDESFAVQTRPNLRRQVAPTRPGRVLVGFDFAQIEARVIALVSGDPFLCKIFAEGRDPHIECARIVFDGFDSFDEKTQKALREQVKPIEYGAMYLAQLETLHKQLLKDGSQIKLADLGKALNRLLNAMSGLVRWQQEAIANASRPPYEVRDFVLGRRRVWPLGQVEGSEAVNSNVQPAAAAIMNTGMARMAPRLATYQEAYAIGQFHDACMFECWEDDAARLAADIDAAYTQSYDRDGRTIPFPVDIKIGPTWAHV